MTKSAQPPPPTEPEIAPAENPGRQAAQLLVGLRWAKTTPAQRSAVMTQVAAQRTPEKMGAAQRSDKPRCPCGAMTAKRAKARAHKCVAPPAQRKSK